MILKKISIVLCCFFVEKPVLRELGGYKFFQKPSVAKAKAPNKTTNSFRANENQSSEIADLKNTVTEQKKNIANREKHVLQMEKKICFLESENAKCKKQVASSREKLEDCSGTVDYLRREKEQLECDKDRLSYTLLTYEHEIKELTTENANLISEYENAEQSRKIAVGHFQEMERDSQNALNESSSPSMNSTTFTDQLSSLKECVQKLRLDREALKEEHRNMGVFFEKNLKTLLDRFGEMDKKPDRSLGYSEKTVDEGQVIVQGENVANADEIMEEVGEEFELEDFRRRLKSNEQLIDQLANEIRELENNKKCLLESRFAMIQEFQAGREVIDAEESDEQGTSSEETKSAEEMAGKGGRKQSNRVTKKIRKLERTLSMDHAVGKLDCIQKLCKNLEACEQKIHDLETINNNLRAEHDDMEEEAKYLKYVLSYRGDVMKAQLEKQLETRVEAYKEELRVANETNSKKDPHSGPTFKELSERNRVLEDEVQRLDDQLKTLLQSLPALQGEDGQRQHGEADTNISQERDDNGETVRSLEEKVTHLTEEKRILLLNMQTLTGQRRSTSRDLPSTSFENDSFATQNTPALVKNLREIESENAQFVETFRRIREVLENDEDVAGSDEHRDSFKISKLKGEMQRLSEKGESSRGSNATVEEKSLGEVFASCARHEERISELEKEVNRLHDEKKTLLSTIIRLQTDPNFTFSDDVTDDDDSRSSLESPVKDMMQAMAVDDEDGPGVAEAVPSHADAATSSSPMLTRSFRDEGVQVTGNNQDLGGLLGYLERDLDRLRNALSQQCVVGYQQGTKTLQLVYDSYEMFIFPLVLIVTVLSFEFMQR